MLIKAIANNCPRIKRLDTYLEPKDFFHVKLLLLNCKNLESVKFNCLDYIVNENDNVGDQLLDILAKFSQNPLVNIELDRGWKYSLDAFVKFFDSYRKRNLDVFGISDNGKNYITDDHRAIIEKYHREGVIEYWFASRK